MELENGGTEQVEEHLATSSLTVGFNSTLRNLEGLARDSSPVHHQRNEGDGLTAKPMKTVVVFACPASVAPPTLDSLPLLVATASLAIDKSESICLVKISAQGETAISHALGLPRVGLLALGESLPGSQALTQYVRTQVGAIDVPWLKEASNSSYLRLKVNTINVPVGAKGSKKRKASDGSDEG